MNVTDFARGDREDGRSDGGREYALYADEIETDAGLVAKIYAGRFSAGEGGGIFGRRDEILWDCEYVPNSYERVLNRRMRFERF